jgi:hypothetical protein
VEIDVLVGDLLYMMLVGEVDLAYLPIQYK